jgi:hypothetical protein
MPVGFNLTPAVAEPIALAKPAAHRPIALPTQRPAGEGIAFGKVLAKHLRHPPAAVQAVDNDPAYDANGEDADRRAQAEKAAAGLVSAALILPVLKQLRRSPWGDKGPFSPGNAEKSFGPQFDMQLADRLSNSPRLGVTKALADRIMKRGMPKTAAAAKGLDVHG